MSTTNTHDVQAAIDAVERLHEPKLMQLVDSDEIEQDLLIVPKGMEVRDLKPFHDTRRERPERRIGTARLTTLGSFIAHVKRFADEHTAVFAVDDPAKPRLVCVYDYHEKSAIGLPRFGAHRAEYAFPLDDAWKRWTQLGPLTQAELALLLEDRIQDVLLPDDAGTSALELAQSLQIKLAGPSELLAVSRGISIRSETKVRQAVNLRTGETQVSFDETHGGDGSVVVPGGFALGIPVFRAGAIYKVLARLRYRMHGGAIAWGIALHRTEIVFEHAFLEALMHVERETMAQVFRGLPES